VTVIHKLPRPPIHEPEASESNRVIRERSFTQRGEITSILDHLRETKATGQLIVDLSQGGIGTVRFREEKKLPSREEFT
jgi:hypothetical protein